MKQESGKTNKGQPPIQIHCELKILLIDDDNDCLDNLAEALILNNFPCEKYLNPEEALEIIKNVHCDAVITDIKMPGMDGISFAKNIKAHYPCIHVIILTGYPTIENAIDALNIGVDAYLIKPIRLESLLQTLNKIKEKIILHKRKENSIRQFIDGIARLKDDFDNLSKLTARLGN